jgi:hypothetical protein
MTTDSVAPESVPAENVFDAPVEVADAAPPETPAVADSTPAPAAGEIPAKKQEGFSKRIDELTRDFYGEKRARERAEDEARTLREQVEALKPKPVETPSVAPKLEDFAFDEEKYRSALVAYARTEAANAARDELRKEREQAQQQTRAESFATRQSEYLAKNPDYQNKVLENPRLPISTVMREAIIDSELGPQVALYLADNTELATRIFHLKDPLLVGREIGRIEAKLEQPAPAIVPKAKVSEAPPPPPKLEAVDASPPKSIDDPKISDAEFARIRRRQIAQRR